MENIKTIKLEKLDPRKLSLFKAVMNESSTDPFLFGYGKEDVPKERCIVILYGSSEVPIGFYTPRKQNVKGKDHWRAGTLFIQKAYQNKGIMYSVLNEFFSTHLPGLSWIDNTNTKSIKLFKKLGFIEGKARTDDDGSEGHWWVKGKSSVANECYKYSW